MAFLKNYKLTVIREEGTKYDSSLDNVPNITSDLKNSPGYFFWLKKLKNDIKIALKATGIKL